MKPSASPSSARRHGGPRRHLARLVQASLLRLNTLADHAAVLRRRIADCPAYAALRERIDGLLSELQSANLQLAHCASALGARIGRQVARHSAKLNDVWAEASTLPADLVATLAEDCRHCGTRLCALMRAAQIASDTGSAKAAYSLLRTLEKQLWLLSPHSEGSSHPFILSPRPA